VEEIVALEQLLERLDKLERRLMRLELQQETQPGEAETEATETTDQNAVEVYQELTISNFWLSKAVAPATRGSRQPAAPATPLDAAHGIFGSVAKAIFGIAGAYLLRAGTETGWFPAYAGLLAAFAYALAWLLAAGRISKSAQASSIIYVLASSTIVVGLLWENAVSAVLLPAPIAALMIIVYLGAGQFVASIRARREIAAVTLAATVGLSLLLLVATHDLIPFNVTLLCAVAVSEFAACRGRWLSQRWIAAFGADFAILITSWIFSQSPTLPEGYAPFSQSSVLGIQLALVIIYLASTSYRVLAARTVLTGFEIVQNVAATGLLVLNQIVMTSAGTQRLLVGVICFIIALGAYLVSILLAHKRAQRNSLTFGIFGLALEITAIFTVAPPYARPFELCVLGVGAAWLGSRERQTVYRWHAPVYLFAAVLVCGLARIAVQSLTNVNVPRPDHLITMLTTTASVALVYAMISFGGAGKPLVPSLFCASLLACGALGLGAIAIEAALGGWFFATSLRIALICLGAVGAARLGILNRSSDRPEWVWLSYGLMLYGAWRIVVEDLQSGRPAASALSLLAYGGTLLLLSRLLRSRHLTETALNGSASPLDQQTSRSPG